MSLFEDIIFLNLVKKPKAIVDPKKKMTDPLRRASWKSDVGLMSRIYAVRALRI